VSAEFEVCGGCEYSSQREKEDRVGLSGGVKEKRAATVIAQRKEDALCRTLEHGEQKKIDPQLQTEMISSSSLLNKNREEEEIQPGGRR